MIEPGPSVEAARTAIGGRYVLGDCIARGATSTVHLAHDLRLNRRVVIKRSAPAPGAAEAIRHEAALLARLSHPGIVSCLDLVEGDGGPALVLEYLEGPDLAALSAPSGVPSLADGLRWAVQLCRAVAYLHHRGVVHGDLKPQHAILTGRDRVVLIDLGLAAARQQEHAIEGSAAYLAPEVRAGDGRSESADRYALGVLLYRLFTGVLPYAASDDRELARLHATAPVPSLAGLRRDAPLVLDTLVARLLAKQPGERPGIGAVLDALTDATAASV